MANRREEERNGRGALRLSIALIVALCVVAWLAFGAAAPARTATGEDPAYRVDPRWPVLPQGWLLGDVPGVSVDRHDHVWVLHRPRTLRAVDTLADDDPPTAHCCAAAPPVLEIDTSGQVLRSWGGPGEVEGWFETEHSIFVDAEDFVWVVGSGARDGQVMKFTMDGELLLRIGGQGDFIAPDDPAMLGRPTDIYVDTGRREVFVSDGYRNRRVIVFDADTGAFLRQWTAFGRAVDPAFVAGVDGDGDIENFAIVHCVTMIEGEVHVCDRTNSRVQVFTPAGEFLRELFFNRSMAGAQGGVWDAAPVPGRPGLVFVLDGINSEIALLDRRSGDVVASHRSKGRYAGQMHWPHQLAADSAGNVYVAEVGGSQRIQRFVPQGVSPAGGGAATFVTEAEIARTLEAMPFGDRNIRVVDIGHENFAIGFVHRGRTVNGVAENRPAYEGPPPGSCGLAEDILPQGGRRAGIVHYAQTEGYYVTSGGGTMFTGGYLVNGREYPQVHLNGPTCIGTAYDVTVRSVEAGDVVVVPAGVVHGWIDVPDHVDYISFRPSPGILEAGWVHPAIGEPMTTGE
ncbi:NHL repeat-containing protein [Parasphingopyxis marina]|uniref:Peptidylamidoglycolate lyase n=1 Tax=Parasphingopyxis marina TaxID=2761622 RepID=A0A842HVE2_9SPHN|nr:hypothetical protein [Parasphingopyxis marina]MBC2777988.1 hypothetical protein [Parasphingopyxis marina]